MDWHTYFCLATAALFALTAVASFRRSNFRTCQLSCFWIVYSFCMMLFYLIPAARNWSIGIGTFAVALGTVCYFRDFRILDWRRYSA